MHFVLRAHELSRYSQMSCAGAVKHASEVGKESSEERRAFGVQVFEWEGQWSKWDLKKKGQGQEKKRR